uniref:Uncharacterized protein n=1 Tax=Globodera rostochiensis TaxID=31243 RepID=A0A914HRB5_GLORO
MAYTTLLNHSKKLQKTGQHEIARCCPNSVCRFGIVCNLSGWQGSEKALEAATLLADTNAPPSCDSNIADDASSRPSTNPGQSSGQKSKIELVLLILRFWALLYMQRGDAKALPNYQRG